MCHSELYIWPPAVKREKSKWNKDDESSLASNEKALQTKSEALDKNWEGNGMPTTGLPVLLLWGWAPEVTLPSTWSRQFATRDSDSHIYFVNFIQETYSLFSKHVMILSES